MSLIAVIPAFSATGRVNFLSDVDDLESVVEFTKQGGSFTVLVIDSDLNQSVKNVLIPAQDMTSFQTSLEPIDIGDDGLSITVAGDRTGDLGKDDTVLLSGHTVRRVTSVTLNDGGTPVDASDDTTIIGVNLAVSITAGATETLYEVTNTDATDEKCPTCAEAEGVQLDSAAASFNLNSSPISDSGVGFETVVGVNTEYLHRVTGRTDGDIFREDDILIQLSTDLTTVVVVAALSSEGHVTVAADASRATATYYVSYWGTQFDNTGEAVKITSTADPSGMTLTLNETGRRTGAFSGVVMASGSRTSATTTPPMIKVGESDTIRIAYSDANPSRTTRGSLRVESTSPAFSSLSPAHDVSGRAAQRDLIADVTDGGSGVDDASIQFVVAIGPAGGTIIEDAEIIGGDFVRVRNPQGGSIFNGSALPAATFVGIGDKTVYWWAVAADKAANVAVTDREASKDFLDSGTTNVEGDIVGIEITTASDADKEDLSTVTLDDPCDPDAFLKAAQDDSLDGRNSALSHVTAVDPNTGEVIVLNGVYGCQPFSYSIDASAPQIDRVVTGTFWDDDSDEDDKTEHDSTKAMKTSIYVEFNEDLDPASVDRGDFTIVFTDEDGNTTTATPVNAEVFSGAQHAVFLTVRALDPDAAPTVEVSGIADAAGNSLDDDDQESVDGIAPTITATITGTATANGRAVSDDEISISITVDEPVAAPRVTVYEVEAISAADVEATTNIDESAAAITKVAQRGGTRNAVLQDDGSYLYKFRGSADSLYSALIEADDSQAGNTGKKGDVTLPISVESDTSALLFEIDTKVSDPVITPESTDNLNPFITFDFAAEGKEYTALDEDGDKVDVDSHGTVTIMSATFNGTDIAADLCDD